MSSPRSPHTTSLSGEHVNGDSELTKPSQPDTHHHSSSPSTQNNPFTFPTLGLDGSLFDLASASHYSPTPPAALSSLGAKAKMADHNSDALSEASLDAQYDMIDDISDVSDGHETASLLSQHDEEDEETPEGSMVRVGASDHDAAGQDATLRENDLIDSYLTEDLETPRQSTVKGFLTRRGLFTSSSSESSSFNRSTFKAARRVLFVSDRSVTDDTLSDICLRIASCLLPTGQAMENSISRFVRLPANPSGTSPSSALFVRVGQVELLVEHCVDASSRKVTASSEMYFLQIQDADKEHTSTFTVGKGTGRMDLQPPDLVVYYLTAATYPAWFDHVKAAMTSADPPSITVADAEVNFDDIPADDGKKICESDIVLNHEKLFHEDDEDLSTDIQNLLMNKNAHKRMATSPETASPKASASARLQQTFLDRVGIKLATENNFRWTSLLAIFFMLLAITVKPYLHLLDSGDKSTAIEMRREALSIAFAKVTNSTETALALNTTHLIPSHEVVWSTRERFLPPVLSQGVTPNHILVSLPPMTKLLWTKYPQVVSTSVFRSGTRIRFNSTQLIDGVYDITINSDNAFGLVTVDMMTHNPEINVIVEHNFGHGLLARKTYEKASMEVSKQINKDLMVARKNAQSLSDRMGMELSAGAAATKNVTTELAIYIARDLQVLANTAVSVFNRAAAASNETAINIKKELAVVRKDIMQLSQDMQKSLVAKANSAKSLIPSVQPFKRRLALARARAIEIKKVLAGYKDANSTSATKDISLRLQHIFKPNEKTKKAGSLVDIARCSRAKDYRACRKLQKAPKMWESLTSAMMQPTNPVKAPAESSTSLPPSPPTLFDVKADSKRSFKGSKKDGKKNGKTQGKLAGELSKRAKKAEKQRKKAAASA